MTENITTPLHLTVEELATLKTILDTSDYGFFHKEEVDLLYHKICIARQELDKKLESV